jgi:hypothetical protein
LRRNGPVKLEFTGLLDCIAQVGLYTARHHHNPLASVGVAWYDFFTMSTREALILEIMQQPEPLLDELKRYLAVLKERQVRGANGSGQPTAGWPAGYFQRTAGAFADEPLERPPQLPFEKREEW